MTIQELELKLKKIRTELRSILDDADEETLTPAEGKRYDKLETQAKRVECQIEEIRLNGHLIGPIKPSAGFVSFESRSDEYRHNPSGTTERDYYNRYLLTGLNGMPTAAFLANEQRALKADLDPAGGWLVPQAQLPQLVQALDDVTVIRNRCTRFNVKANEVIFPSLDQDPADPTWVAEVSTGSEDDELRIGSRRLSPHPLAERIKVSDTLMRLSSISPESIIRNRFAARVGAVLENSAMIGDGNSQYLRLFVDHEMGIDSSRDRESATTAAVKADDLIDLAADLPSQYRKNAVWIASREFLRRISKLKDGSGSYIVQQDLQSEFGTMLLGHELLISEFAPSSFASGTYACIFGNLQHYWVVDALNLRIQKLTELYAEQNQVGLILRMETDGAPVLAAAFKRLKLK